MSGWKPHKWLVRTNPGLQYRYKIRVQGSCVEVSKRLPHSSAPPGSVRGVVTTFTRKSMMNMLRTIAKIDWGKVPCGVFVTLTFPDVVWNPDFTLRTMYRSRWIRDIEKHLGKEIPLIWRCEWKARKTGKHKGQIRPHFHLMLLGVRFLAHTVVRSVWRSALQVTGDLATDVRAITGAEGCGRYLAKYISKATSLDNGAYLNNPHMAGRHWGICRPGLIPWAPIERNDELTEAEFEDALAAWMSENEWADQSYSGSFTVLGEILKQKFLEKLNFPP